jgi:hypothetical protein
MSEKAPTEEPPVHFKTQLREILCDIITRITINDKNNYSKETHKTLRAVLDSVNITTAPRRYGMQSVYRVLSKGYKYTPVAVNLSIREQLQKLDDDQLETLTQWSIDFMRRENAKK